MRFLLWVLLNFFFLVGLKGVESSATQDIGSLISKDLFERMLKHRNDASCQAKGFYTYEAFMAAAKSFGAFGTTGDVDTRKREIAAFLAQTSHKTAAGGRATSPDGPYAWGYCNLKDQDPPPPPPTYCNPNKEWGCRPGKKYFGRGPIQISYNYNYGPAGKAIGSDLLQNPDLVATDATVSFKTAFWFWNMTPQSPKPSCHDVMTGKWTSSPADTTAGRVAGYGLTTNIIDGGIKCGKGANAQDENQIGFYKRYCDMLGVSYGNNLACNNQQPFA